MPRTPPASPAGAPRRRPRTLLAGLAVGAQQLGLRPAHCLISRALSTLPYRQKRSTASTHACMPLSLRLCLNNRQLRAPPLWQVRGLLLDTEVASAKREGYLRGAHVVVGEPTSPPARCTARCKAFTGRRGSAARGLPHQAARRVRCDCQEKGGRKAGRVATTAG